MPLPPQTLAAVLLNSRRKEGTACSQDAPEAPSPTGRFHVRPAAAPLEGPRAPHLESWALPAPWGLSHLPQGQPHLANNGQETLLHPSCVAGGRQAVRWVRRKGSSEARDSGWRRGGRWEKGVPDGRALGEAGCPSAGQVAVVAAASSVLVAPRPVGAVGH